MRAAVIVVNNLCWSDVSDAYHCYRYLSSVIIIVIVHIYFVHIVTVLIVSITAIIIVITVSVIPLPFDVFYLFSRLIFFNPITYIYLLFYVLFLNFYLYIYCSMNFNSTLKRDNLSLIIEANSMTKNNAAVRTYLLVF